MSASQALQSISDLHNWSIRSYEMAFFRRKGGKIFASAIFRPPVAFQAISYMLRNLAFPFLRNPDMAGTSRTVTLVAFG